MVGKVTVSKPKKAASRDVASPEAVARIWSRAAKIVRADAPAVQARRLRSLRRATG